MHVFNSSFRFLSYLSVMLSLLCIVSCGDDTDPLMPGSQRYGSLKFSLMPLSASQTDNEVLDMLGIVTVEIEIKGTDIDESIAVIVGSDGSQGEATIKAPEGKNRVILITGRNETGDKRTVIKGYVDVKADETVNAEVNWRTTPVGDVIEKLIEKDYDDIDNCNAAELQELVDDTIEQEGIHPIYINTEQIAEAIMRTKSNPPRLTSNNLSTVTGKVLSPDGKAICPCSTSYVFINHPPFRTIDTRSDGKFEITGVTPGVWDIVTNGGGNITVHVKDEGILPAQIVIRNTLSIPIQEGIIDDTHFCNGEFGFRISRPDEGWTIRMPNASDPPDAIVLIEKGSEDEFSYTQIYVMVLDVPKGIRICDELDEIMDELVEEVNFGELTGLPITLEEEPSREININGQKGCEVLLRMKVEDPNTGKKETIAFVNFAFLQHDETVYVFTMTAIGDEGDIGTILSEFGEVLGTFQIL